MKKIIAILLAMVLMLTMFTACAKTNEPAPEVDEPVVENETPAEEPEKEIEYTEIKLAAMKGPTGMGMVEMLDRADKGETGNTYTYNIVGTADEIAPLLIKGELDAAAVPCNLASTLYNKTEGEVIVAAVNTLGVLYVVENGESVSSIEDLRGKTIYSTGQGTTPEYIFRSILSQNGIDPDTDVTIEYKSESTEIAALLGATDESVIAVLPQPYVTAVQTQNENVRIALDLTEEWEKVNDGSVVTGTLVVRKSFAEEHPDAFGAMLEDYKQSVEFVNSDVEAAAALIEQYDIAKAAVAKKALPYCNITFMTGEEMKEAVSAYLQVLFDQNPAAVGGNMPDDAFYYGA